MRVTQNFIMIADAYNKGYDLIAEQGGQGSSKTYSTMQLIYKIAKKPKKRRITVCSYALPHLKGGAMNDLENILIEENVNINDVKNKSESIFNINNSIIEFIGLESNPSRVTGTRRDILYINEANNKISYEVFDLANSRTHECTFIDFNPRNEFWFHEKIQPNFKHAFIKSNFTHNEYIPKRELENILSKKDKPGFENWWKVYGLGEIGRLEGAIFENWSFGEFDNTLPYVYGLDFGVKDPDAMIKVAVDRKNMTIYLDEILYKDNQSTDELVTSIKLKDIGNSLIIADSAAPRTIKDLKAKKFNIESVVKNKIIDDIKAIKDYQLIITPNSYNLSKELNNYIWLDKKGEVPIDEYNHLLDSMRYGIMKLISRRKVIK